MVEVARVESEVRPELVHQAGWAGLVDTVHRRVGTATRAMRVVGYRVEEVVTRAACPWVDQVQEPATRSPHAGAHHHKHAIWTRTGKRIAMIPASSHRRPLAPGSEYANRAIRVLVVVARSSADKAVTVLEGVRACRSIALMEVPSLALRCAWTIANHGTQTLATGD